MLSLREQFIKIIVDIFDDEEISIKLLTSVNFPSNKIPPFNNPYNFWSSISLHIQNNNDNFEAILIKAAQYYPSNHQLEPFKEPSLGMFKRYYLDFFCTVFDEAHSIILLNNINFPIKHRPQFTTGYVFWSAIFDLINQGMLADGGLNKLLLEAKKVYPGNSVFKKNLFLE